MSSEPITTIADLYRRRADAFERKVAAVELHQWSNQSPCDEWTARDVVEHVVDMHLAMLHPLGHHADDVPTVAHDPLAAFTSARASVLDILNDPDLAHAMVDMPSGYMTAAQYIDSVLSDDLPLHGWDLAKATGQDDTIDPSDVEQIWATINALPEEMLVAFRAPDVKILGPEVKIPANAPLQHRLLGALGRDAGHADSAVDPSERSPHPANPATTGDHGPAETTQPAPAGHASSGNAGGTTTRDVPDVGTSNERAEPW
jgi:uncharacterized protein (TIGR03086 family)